ncbi:glycosyltransferase family 4 protein [Patescibacteria group bacterium]|nr:glycosyltransferase family 4 protein [Patescibacteria group bacterium]
MKLLAIGGGFDPKKIGGAEAHFVEVLKRIAPSFEKVTLINEISYPKIPNLSWLTYSIFVIPEVLKEKFDIIWLKQEYLCWAGLFLKLLTRKPVYVTCQNPNLATEEWVGKGRAAQVFQKYLGPMFNTVLMFPLRYMDTVAAVSSYSAGLAKKYGAKKVVIIPNGVDTAKFQVQNSQSQKNSKIKIITTSSLIPRNGIDTLIEACGDLDIPFELTVAGEGPQRRELENLVTKLGLTDKIVFLGRVDSEKIPQLLAKSDLFVRPSRFEGFGNSFIEAMAAGIPVIGTPVGGIIDFLDNNKTGLLVTPDDPTGLAQAIEKIYKDSKLREKLVRNARMLVAEKYDWGNISRKVEEHLIQLA